MKITPESDNMGEPWRRSNGTFRAHFKTKEEADLFAQDPANWPTYKGDVSHKCPECGWWHLSKIEWLAKPGDIIEIGGTYYRVEQDEYYGRAYRRVGLQAN